MTKYHGLAAAIYTNNIAQEILPYLMTPETNEIGFHMLQAHITKCIIKHSGEFEADSAEEGIVMLADVLDNTEIRIKDAPPHEIVINDPKPIEYFSCKNISNPIEITRGDVKKVNIIVNLKGDAGWHHVGSCQYRRRYSIICGWKSFREPTKYESRHFARRCIHRYF